MEIDNSEIQVHGPGKRDNWYASSGISDSGVVTDVQIFAEDEDEAKAIGQGMAIGHNLHMNRGPRYVASRSEFEECFGEDED